MKIIQINVVYGKGSTGKIVQDIHQALLLKGYDSKVIYGRSASTDHSSNIMKAAPEFIMKLQSLRAKITGYAYAGCYISTHNIIKTLKVEKPDIVHIHCINGYMVNIYKLLDYLKTNKIRTIITYHAEFMYTGGCGYSFECDKWKSNKGCSNCPQKSQGLPCSKLFDRSHESWVMMAKTMSDFNDVTICTVSDWVKDRAKQTPFLKDKRIVTVKNGLDTAVFQYRKTDLRRKLGIKDDEKIVLHVTPNFYFPIKGGKYVIEVAKKLPSVKFIIVGYNGDGHDLPKNIIPISHTQNQIELAEYYSLADITLLPSKKETYSMVCAESLSCGTPVVGFLAGGPETISINEYSEFVPYDDVDSLISAMKKWLHKEIDKNDLSNEAKKIYGIETMVHSYINEYFYIMDGINSGER